MEEKLNGIVIGSVNFGENDKMLSIFTAEKGTVCAKIKGVKKAGAKLKFATEPFCFSEYVLNESRGYKTVIGASLIDSFYPIREDVVKFFSAGTVIEYLKRFLKEGIVSPDMFILSVDCLKNLAYGDKKPKQVLASFLVKALSLSGYGLYVGNCLCCGKKIHGRAFFDYERGGFFCEECNEKGKELNYSTMLSLEKIINGIDLDDFSVNSVLKLLYYYIKNKPEENLNSLSELIKL